MKNQKSDVSFKNESRIHFGLRVSDLNESITFYSKLLDAEPSKVREGYAKFDLDSPSVNLSLNQTAKPIDPHGAVNHFGIQLQSTKALGEEIARLSEAGLEIDLEEQTSCCHALQDKAWATDPDGNRWEYFVVTDNQPQDEECCDRSDENCCEKQVACC